MPQAQQVRQSQGQSQSQKQITFQQSYECVKTMVEAGLGCITYLRGLLPDDHFVDDGVNVLPGKAGSSSSQKMGDKGLKIKKIKREFSPEGDKLLSYLEKGVFDAVERQFLKSMVLSVYLDPNEPNNVIETYTFNFSYHHVEGVGTIPVLEMERSMKTMTVGSEPLAPPLTGVENGKPLTIGEVKKRVKGLIKNLILMTQMLDELPRKRCIGLKLFYRPDAPPDYQPPMFRAANPDEKLYFGTRHAGSKPEISEIGSAETGYHGVNITIRTIVDQLPKLHTAQKDDAPFGVPAEAVEGDFEELKAQDQEAVDADHLARDILWNAEEQTEKHSSDLQDADGEPDPDASPRSVLPQPIFNAAFAKKTAPNQYRPYTRDQMRKMAAKNNQEMEENPREEIETPSSQQATQMMMAKKKHGEGDRGHKVKESRDKLKTLAQTPTEDEDSQRMAATQPIASSIGPPPTQSHVEMDEDEPSFAEGRPTGDESPAGSSSKPARTKPKFQPLMPAHREENEDDIAETQMVPARPVTRRTSSRLLHVQDDEDDPIGSFSNSNEEASSAEVEQTRPKKKAVTSSAPAAPKNRKKNVRRVIESDDDIEEIDRPQSQKNAQQPKRASSKSTAKPKTKKKSPSKTNSASGPSRAASRTDSGTQPKKGIRRNSSKDMIEIDDDGNEVDPELQKLGRQCWCGDRLPDKAADTPEAVCDGCELWMHLNCHGGEDRNELKGQKFFCAKCELKADPHTKDWDAAKIEDAIQGFRTLALFRRTLLLVRDKGLIANLARLTKQLACSIADAQMMLNRLELEGFVRRVDEKAAAAIFSSQPTHRKGFEAVKNETTRAAMKAYFDRSSRKLEHKAWGFPDGDEGNGEEQQEQEQEQEQPMDLDEEYPPAQPLPGPSSFLAPSQPALIDFFAASTDNDNDNDQDENSLPLSQSQTQTQFQPGRTTSLSLSQMPARNHSLSLSQMGRPATPDRALSLSSAHNFDRSPPIAPRSSYEASYDVDAEFGQTQMQPARVPSSSAMRRRSSDENDARMASNSNGHVDENSSSGSGTSTSSKGKRKAEDDGGGRTMSLADAMEATGVAELGQGKRMRASVSEGGVDISY